MPSFLEVQSGTRPLTVTPFPDAMPDFHVDLQERIARDPALEKDQMARFKASVKDGEESLARAYRILEAVSQIDDAEPDKPVADPDAPAKKRKAKDAKQGVSVVPEDAKEDYLDSRNPIELYNAGKLTKQEAEQMAIMHIYVLNGRNVDDPRHNLCVAFCARITDWNLTHDGDRKIPLTDAQTLDDFVDAQGRGVSTQLLEAILKAVEDAPLIPKAKN